LLINNKLAKVANGCARLYRAWFLGSGESGVGAVQQGQAPVSDQYRCDEASLRSVPHTATCRPQQGTVQLTRTTQQELCWITVRIWGVEKEFILATDALQQIGLYRPTW